MAMPQRQNHAYRRARQRRGFAQTLEQGVRVTVRFEWELWRLKQRLERHVS